MILIVSGLFVILAGDGAAVRVFVGAALGGTVYSTINSAGHDARSGTRGAVTGLGVLTVLAVAALAVVILSD